MEKSLLKRASFFGWGLLLFTLVASFLVFNFLDNNLNKRIFFNPDIKSSKWGKVVYITTNQKNKITKINVDDSIQKRDYIIPFKTEIDGLSADENSLGQVFLSYKSKNGEINEIYFTSEKNDFKEMLVSKSNKIQNKLDVFYSKPYIFLDKNENPKIIFASNENGSPEENLNNIFIYGCRGTSSGWLCEAFDGVDVSAKGGKSVVKFEDGMLDVKKDADGNFGITLAYPTTNGFRIRYFLVDSNFNKISQVSEINTSEDSMKGLNLEFKRNVPLISYVSKSMNMSIKYIMNNNQYIVDAQNDGILNNNDIVTFGNSELIFYYKRTKNQPNGIYVSDLSYLSKKERPRKNSEILFNTFNLEISSLKLRDNLEGIFKSKYITSEYIVNFRYVGNDGNCGNGNFNGALECRSITVKPDEKIEAVTLVR